MEYVVVIGSNMSNKGAQSMLFQIVNEISKRYPSKKVVAFISSKKDIVEKMSGIYNFEIIPFQTLDILFLYGGIQAVAARILGVSRKNIKQLREILQKTCIAFDVSGYSLSSNWRGSNSIKYLYRIAILKKYRIPTVIMPQSFGPFDYEPLLKPYINRLGKKLMSYPSLIFAREPFSYDCVKKHFDLNTVYLSNDMVLLGRKINPATVLKPTVSLQKIQIEQACVAVIPNDKLAEKFSFEKALAIYRIAICRLLKYQRTIYIVQHSEADGCLCQKIKMAFQENDAVVLLQEDLNCLEYNAFIKQFDYVIASRYHSLVHAYRQNVPCIAIGWSEKYNNLMKIMGQSQYMVDAKNFDKELLLTKIDAMQEHFPEERQMIAKFFENQNADIYNTIFEKIEVKD